MQPKGYVDSSYLQLAAELTRPAKLCSHAAMLIQPGQRVLDVGCGTGADTIPLARLVGSKGQVLGVDLDPAMITRADEQAREAGVSAWVVHRVADATSLPFADEEFDASRSERLFQHVGNPEKVLAEMSRVTKADGKVVVMDTDWGTISIDTPLVNIERRLARVHAEHYRQNGVSGRQLYRLFKRQGLKDISIEMFPMFTTHYGVARLITRLDEVEKEAVALGIVNEDELGWWHASVEKVEAEGVFFASLSMVLAAGIK